MHCDRLPNDTSFPVFFFFYVTQEVHLGQEGQFQKSQHISPSSLYSSHYNRWVSICIETPRRVETILLRILKRSWITYWAIHFNLRVLGELKGAATSVDSPSAHKAISVSRPQIGSCSHTHTVSPWPLVVTCSDVNDCSAKERGVSGGYGRIPRSYPSVWVKKKSNFLVSVCVRLL